MSDPILYAVLATFALIYLIGIALWSLRTKPKVTPRDPMWFTDQHREERRAQMARFSQPAVKGFEDARKVERVAGVVTPPTGKAS